MGDGKYGMYGNMFGLLMQIPIKRGRLKLALWCIGKRVFLEAVKEKTASSRSRYEQSDTNMLIDHRTYCDTYTSMISPVEPNALPLSSLRCPPAGQVGLKERGERRGLLAIRKGK